MRLKYVAMLFAALALSLALFACSSGDDDDSSGDSGQPTATTEASGGGDASDSADQPTATEEASGDGDGGGSGSGSGTLTIGAETWEISGVRCVFSAEEAQNPDFPFNLAGSSTSTDGASLYLEASIYDPTGQERHEGDGVIHSISVYDLDFENVTVDWGSESGLLGGETVVTVDEKDIHGEGLFDDGTTDAFEAVPGTMDVSCP